jgi:alkylation response protein AidB-like acyl-CoA dehydrogenase
MVQQSILPRPDVGLALDVQLLPELIREPVERTRDEASDLRRLPDELVATLRAAGAFRLSTPVELGGFELPIRTSTELYEALGHLDGPVAWNIWNGNVGFAAALLPEAAVGEVWGATSDPIIANSARPAGLARPVAGGLALSGRWDIVSAVDIADWVALFAFVADGDTPRVLPNGAPDLRVFFMRRDEIAVLDTWHTIGMRATSSNTVVAHEVVVPEHRTVSPFAPARIDRALYRVPPFTIASHGAAPIVVGIAQAAIDAVLALAPTKRTYGGSFLSDLTATQSALGAAQTALDAARALLREAATAIDAAAELGAAVDVPLRARMRAAMSHAGVTCRQVLATCRQLASSSAVFADQPIHRLLADGEVALQHVILAPLHLDIRGRLMVGLDAGTPVV